MSKLDELIRELCPDGVAYIPISNCVEKVSSIKWAKTDDEDYQYIDLTSVDRDTHTIAETQTINAENAPSRAQQIVRLGDILFGATRPMLKRYCMINSRFDGQICSTGFCVLRAKEDIVLQRWLYHNISSSDFFSHVEKMQKGASYPAISDADVKSYQIPVPPIEVQREIVRILDNFTELSAELAAKLAEGLSLRKKQYEYYANALFENVEDCAAEYTIGDVIVSLKTGLNPRTNFKLNENGSCFPYITGKDIFNNRINVTERTDKITSHALMLINKRAQLEANLLLFASTGTGTVGRMAVIEVYENNWGMSETLYGIKVNAALVIPHYLMYYLYSTKAKTQFEPKISKGSVPHLKVNDLLNVKIPVPAIKEQEKIVEELQRLECFCTNLSSSLSAEIEARRKQYEYYRDKLLTFKPLA